MSFTAIVENDIIKLPPGVHLPDGTEVSVEPRPQDAHAAGTESLLAFLERYSGCIKDAPPDMAENHDYYAHGAPKGIDKL